MIDEFLQAYGCENRKARKEHRCYECNGVIRAGETYTYHHGILDGSGCSFKVCQDCQYLRDWFERRTVYPEDGVAFGELYEHVFESGDFSAMMKYIHTRRMRNANVPDWMERRMQATMERMTR